METGIDKPEVVLSDYVIDYTHLNIDQRVLVESETDGYDFRYTYGLDLVNVKATGEGTSWWAQSVKKCVYSDYVHTDRLGSVVNLTDQYGRVPAQIDYDDWGKVTAYQSLNISGGYRTVLPEITYAGHQYDDVLGMYYAKARMYDAENRRFASVDPVKGRITEPMTMVQYLYVVGNPLRWVDPLGQEMVSSIDHHDSNGGAILLSGDEAEFGKNSDTYLILQDLQNRWNNRVDNKPFSYYQEIACDARRLARADTPYRFGNNEIKNLLHENASYALAVQKSYALYENLDVPQEYAHLDFAWLVINHFNFLGNPHWDYKWDDHWRVPYDTFDGKDMNQRFEDGSYAKNWTDWIYFEGKLMGADKLANLNWGYVGTKMGYNGFMLFNCLTTGGGDDVYIQMGVDLANSGY